MKFCAVAFYTRIEQIRCVCCLAIYGWCNVFVIPSFIWSRCRVCALQPLNAFIFSFVSMMLSSWLTLSKSRHRHFKFSSLKYERPHILRLIASACLSLDATATEWVLPTRTIVSYNLNVRSIFRFSSSSFLRTDCECVGASTVWSVERQMWQDW